MIGDGHLSHLGLGSVEHVEPLGQLHEDVE